MSLGPGFRRLGRVVVLVAGYFGVLSWLTWPLASSLASRLPAAAVGLAWQHDLYYSVWVMAHGSHALTSSAASFANANIYHPAASALFYGPAGLGALPLFSPVFLVSGNPALASNVTFLLGLALTGVAMHWIVHRWTGSDLAGAVGAVTVLFNYWLLWGFVPAVPHWAALFFLPVIAFVAAACVDSPRLFLLLVPLVLLQCLTDLVYVAPAIFAPLGVLCALRVVRPSQRAAGLRMVGALVLVLLVLAPLYYGYLAIEAANPDLASQSKWTITEASVPTVLPERLFRGFGPFLLTPVGIVLIVAGGLASFLRRRAGDTTALPGGWAHGWLWMIVGGALALHPVVHVAGEVFSSPLALLARWVPSLDAIRVPSRLGIAGLVGFGILSGVAFGEIADRIHAYVKPRGIALALSGALAVVVLASVYHAYAGSYRNFNGLTAMPQVYPLQYAPAPVPESFLPILQSSKAPVLVLPAGTGKDLARPHALAMYRSIGHWYPLLNGYSSYWPAGFSERMTEASRLPARDALDRLVEDSDLAFIWLNSKFLKPAQRSAWGSPPRPSNGRRGLVLVAREQFDLLFAVRPTLTDSTFSE